MTHHAFIDESTRGQRYLICAVTISSADLGQARVVLRSLRPRGHRRIHFATESEQRRRSLLKQMSTLNVRSSIYVAEHRDQVFARGAIVGAAVLQLHRAGVSRLVLEAREGQDHRDRAVIYQALGPDPAPPLEYALQSRLSNRCFGSPTPWRGHGVEAATGGSVSKSSASSTRCTK